MSLVKLKDGSSVSVARLSRKTLVGEARVFDIEVRDHHNFYAGGINVHNCYHSILDDAARRLGEDELYRIKDGFVFYKPPALWLSPSSPSRRNLRGRTRVFAGVDEMGHFSESTDKVNISGLEVWRALTRSLSTVRPAVRRLRKKGVVNVPPAIAVSISSPWEVSDPQMQLYNAAERQGSTYAMMRPTWEANPDITFEDLADEFALDPATAWRDYGCRPPYSAASFVNGLDPFKRCIDRTLRNAVAQRTVVVRPKSKKEAKKLRGISVSAKLKFRWEDDSVPKIMALDAGKHKNAFAVCVAHIDSEGRLAYDAFVEVRPRHNKPVSFTRVYEKVLLPLAKRMNVVVTISDRWQQETIVEKLSEDADTEHFNHRLTYGEFQAWRDDLIHEQLVLPKPEKKVKEILHVEGPEESAFDDCPVSQFIRQSIRVVDVPGKTVDKPAVGNDDVFRTGVLAHAGAQLPEIIELLTQGEVGRKAVGGIGAVATVTGGGSSLTVAKGIGVAAKGSVGAVAR